MYDVFIHVDPPHNVSVTEETVEVEEGEMMEAVLCEAEGAPRPSLYWTRAGEVVAEGDTLKFPEAVSRSDAGEYLCHAANKHGEVTASVAVSVLYRPECECTSDIFCAHKIFSRAQAPSASLSRLTRWCWCARLPASPPTSPSGGRRPMTRTPSQSPGTRRTGTRSESKYQTKQTVSNKLEILKDNAFN